MVRKCHQVIFFFLSSFFSQSLSPFSPLGVPEVVVSGATGPGSILNGLYERIGELPENWYVLSFPAFFSF